MQIAPDTVVSLHYRLRLEDGSEVDSSEADEPLLYLHGRSQIISGLEMALEGRQAGDRFALTVAAEDGYGSYDPALDLRLERAAFTDEQWADLQPEARFQGRHPDDPDRQVHYLVHERHEDHLLVSGNHPLAGRDLHFDVTVVAVRAATATELAQGHASGSDH